MRPTPRIYVTGLRSYQLRYIKLQLLFIYSLQIIIFFVQTSDFALFIQLPDVGDADDTLTPRKSIPLVPTFGALDLGGASMQITFVPKDPSTIPERNLAHLRLYGNDYHIYTHSFSCYGADEARRRLEATLVQVRLLFCMNQMF